MREYISHGSTFLCFSVTFQQKCELFVHLHMSLLEREKKKFNKEDCNGQGFVYVWFCVTKDYESMDAHMACLFIYLS